MLLERQRRQRRAGRPDAAAAGVEPESIEMVDARAWKDAIAPLPLPLAPTSCWRSWRHEVVLQPLKDMAKRLAGDKVLLPFGCVRKRRRATSLYADRLTQSRNSFFFVPPGPFKLLWLDTLDTYYVARMHDTRLRNVPFVIRLQFIPSTGNHRCKRLYVLTQCGDECRGAVYRNGSFWSVNLCCSGVELLKRQPLLFGDGLGLGAGSMKMLWGSTCGDKPTRS